MTKAIFGAFTPGTVDEVYGESNMYTAGIDVHTNPNPRSSSGTWWSQIECHGYSEEEARQFRDYVLNSIRKDIHVLPGLDQTSSSPPTDEGRDPIVYWVKVTITGPDGATEGKVFFDDRRAPHAWTLPASYPGSYFSTGAGAAAALAVAKATFTRIGFTYSFSIEEA